MDSKLYIFFNTIYRYVLVSLYFWLYLLRGLVIYSVIPAFIALLLTVKDLKQKSTEETSVKDIFKHHFNQHDQYRLGSFVFSITTLTLFSSLILLNKTNTKISLMGTIIVFYFLIFTLILFTYGIFYLAFHTKQLKQSVMISFIEMIKKFISSFYILVLIIILLVVAYYNFLLFLVCFPSCFGIGINGVLQNSIAED